MNFNKSSLAPWQIDFILISQHTEKISEICNYLKVSRSKVVTIIKMSKRIAKVDKIKPGYIFGDLKTNSYILKSLNQKRNGKIQPFLSKFWHCECNCGNTSLVRESNLLNGHTKSCGRCLIKSEFGIINKVVVNRVKNSAKKRKIPFHLNEKYLNELFEKQKGLCALTGQHLLVPQSYQDLKNGIQSWDWISLDRINSKTGYVEGNVQWVCKDINFIKWIHTEPKFIDMCRKVVEWQEFKRKNLIRKINYAVEPLPNIELEHGG